MATPLAYQVSRLIDPVLITDGETVTASLDCLNADWASIDILLGTAQTTAAGTLQFSILHSDDLTTYATLAATVSLSNIGTQTGKVRTIEVNTKHRKRYLKLSVTAGAASGDVNIGAVARLHRLDTDPESTSDMVASTTDQTLQLLA